LGKARLLPFDRSDVNKDMSRVSRVLQIAGDAGDQ
jgi:hypothetical protein